MTTASCTPVLPNPAVASTVLASLVGLSLPLLFILLWSSGYVVGKIGLSHTGPLTLLSLRFGLAALVLLLIAVVTRAPWPRRAQEWGHLAVVGLLIQVLHFAGIYEAMRLGLTSGVAALVIGMMPLATALGAHLWLAERIGRWQAIGLLGGLLGVVMVAAGKPILGSGGWPAYVLALLGLSGLLLGTLYQKRFCAGMDLRSGSAVQMAVSAVTVALLAGWHEGLSSLTWSGELVFATLWLGLVNSIGAFSLMFLMIRRGQAGRVAALFYLIPGVSALLGLVVLGEQLPPVALLGFGLSAVAVCISASRNQDNAGRPLEPRHEATRRPRARP